MVNLDKYFDRVYCINLDKRPDRYELVKKEFDKFGITNVQRYSAIDGTTIVNNTPLLAGELGVLQTHYDIIKKCKEEGLKSVLIMEDDVYFTDELNKLDEYMNMVPNDWDLLYFGGNHVYGTPPQIVNDKILKLNFTVALHCVAIKDTIFDTILEVLPNKLKQVDGYYGNLQKAYNGYCFYPNMAKQIAGFSDIQNRTVDYSNFFKD